MKNLHELMGKTASQHQNGTIKFTHNNINPKCKWAKCTNQKTQTGKLDKNPKPISVLYPGNPSHMQEYTKAKNKGMEEDLPSKWRAKKKQELQFPSLIKQILKQQRYSGKRINATRRANDPKYIHTQYRNTQIHKTYKETQTPQTPTQ